MADAGSGAAVIGVISTSKLVTPFVRIGQWEHPLVVLVLLVCGDTGQDGVWYSGRVCDRHGQEFGDRPFDPFPHLPDVVVR